jgi:alpha-ribazole phosphatase
MELQFVRHVQPAIAAGVCYGQLDVPLMAGYDELHAGIAAQLGAVDIVYSSPLQRCVILAARLGAEVVTDARLMELNFGEWEGKQWDEIDRGLLDVWGERYIHEGPPGGESLLELVGRLREFLSELKGVEKVVVVSHAGVVRAAMHLLEGKGLEAVMAEKIIYGGIYTFNL